MLKRLVIISCCALGGFAFGRWLSPPAGTSAVDNSTAHAKVATSAAPLPLPPPALAGRVPFVEVYRSLRSSSTGEHITYLHSIQELPEGPDRRAALTAFFQCMVSINAQEAADLVRQVGKNDVEGAVTAVLAAAPAPDTPVLVKMLLDLPADVDPKWREQKLNGQMYCWAVLDPTAAAQFADQYQTIYPDLAANGVIQCLAAEDPAAAERWLKEHPDLTKKPNVMSNYIMGLYQNDPANARRYLTEHATDEAVQSSLRGIARRTFLSSADDAAAFITHLPAQDARQAALGAILDTNTELFTNSETNQSALFAGMAEWVTKFPPDDWPSFLSIFLGQWRQLDPEGSVNWMAKLPAPTRSAVALQLVGHLQFDEVKKVLTATAGDFHHDVLTAMAEALSQVPADRRNEVIERLELPPEDAAQLAAMR
ncbi:MAG: hypothetical protein ACJ8NS_12985 [Chthoniobacterales bacterium]